MPQEEGAVRGSWGVCAGCFPSPDKTIRQSRQLEREQSFLDEEVFNDHLDRERTCDVTDPTAISHGLRYQQ